MHLRKTRLAALAGIAALALAACGVEFHDHHQQYECCGRRQRRGDVGRRDPPPRERPPLAGPPKGH